MIERFHSVMLLEEKCRGCTNCIKRCPTEAIRVREGKARINVERCIDCGECIRTCDNHAKIAVTDSLQRLSSFEYNVALPAPSLYGQFDPGVEPEKILAAILDMGFDDVFEVAFAADVISLATREFLREAGGPKPRISSACPAVVRLIQVRFPELISYLIPIDSPMEAAAKLCKDEKAEELGLDPENIGAFFITPCPAKAAWIKEANRRGTTHVDGAIAVAEIFPGLLRRVNDPSHRAWSGRYRHRPTGWGIGWGTSGGENDAIGLESHLVVDGIHNVIAVLEEIEMGKLANVDFLEAQSCVGGCVGGPLMVRNPFVGRVNLHKIARAARGQKDAPLPAPDDFVQLCRSGYFRMAEAIEPIPAFRLDEDLTRAISKMEQLEKVLGDLPGLDCGSCGSPNCRALAEDIVQGLADPSDCIFKLREQIRELARELFHLARKDPSALGRPKDDDAGRDSSASS